MDVTVTLTINRAPSEERLPLKDESAGVDWGRVQTDCRCPEEDGAEPPRAENLLMPRVMEMYRCQADEKGVGGWTQREKKSSPVSP
ncbi:hypothetical protein CEXT_594101 [Caerostris extrusa]|uniref:Uncharacterized protein n=1 Tax=Caerostris extrusa TaxID=172846 RepID=A0AAV4T3D1_CAEEX|nr:hypothetical protein CEXT_594101 [Caerostris extrusa]